MSQVIVGPVLQHLRMIGLDGGAVTLATAFYTGRALNSLVVNADSVTVMCRLDFDSIEDWKRGFLAPDSLLSFLQMHQQRGAKTNLYTAPTAHAKVYLGSNAALIGSANLTIRGFGAGHEILTRCRSRRALHRVRNALLEYQRTLTKVELGQLEQYVVKNVHRIRISKAKRRLKKPDQLPKSNRSIRSHLGSYDGFLTWLGGTTGSGASEILARANGKSNLQGHIDRNFHGLRQFLITYPDVFDKMQSTDPDTYKLSQDDEMERKIRVFVDEFASDEEHFVLEIWKTYLPKECGGRAGRHGGTIGNLNYMLPLVAAYMKHSLGG